MNKINELIRQLFYISLDINQTTDYAVFCQFSGHCNLIRVAIGQDKVDKYNDILYEVNCYMNFGDTQSDLKKIIRELKKLKKNAQN